MLRSRSRFNVDVVGDGCEQQVKKRTNVCEKKTYREKGGCAMVTLSIGFSNFVPCLHPTLPADPTRPPHKVLDGTVA
jgi:hypothetical protein